MPRYMFRASYTAQGVEGLLQDGGSGRRAAVEKLIGSVGGRVEAIHFAFGEDDVYVVCELPDHEAAAAVSLVVGASGKARVRTVVLLTPEQIDAAADRSVDYNPPGS